jgi:DNA polymerase III subunit chi
VGEFRFHHCERRRVDQALPALVEGLYAAGRRIVVRAPSKEMADALSDRLWTYDDASFLPHGGPGDDDSASQPIFLTDRIENPNAATVLVLLAGAETGPGDTAFPVAIRLFDGRDAEALGEARREWKRLKDEGAAPSYWREGDEGGWEKAR